MSPNLIFDNKIKFMKKFLTILLLMNFINISAFAFSFDDSIDAELRKDYNVEESTLPALPALPSTVPTATIEQPVVKYNPTGKLYTLKSGTKINISSKSNITDRMGKGHRVIFYANEGFTTVEGEIVPAGILLKGIITNSHTPQMTGNGGLVELKIDEIYFNGLASKIDTKVSLANSKKIFLGNIKGKRSYWKNYTKAMQPGRKAFKATKSCSSELGSIPVVNLISPIPILCGTVIYTLNFVAAPVVAIFTKGGSLSLPAGTKFQVKLTNEAKIKG